MMASISNSIVTTMSRLVPIAIRETGSFYQEKLRGTELQAMVPSAIAKGAYYLAINANIGVTVKHNYRMIIGFGLAWAACAYKGLDTRTWNKDWAVLACLSIVNAVIDFVTPQANNRWTASHSYVSHTNQERIRFALKTVALMAQACALYKLQCDRNGSFPLKPYLYYGASVVLLGRLYNRYSRPNINKIIEGKAGSYAPYAILAFDAFIVFGNMEIASSVAAYQTGKVVQVSRTWEILSLVGARFASQIL